MVALGLRLGTALAVCAVLSLLAHGEPPVLTTIADVPLPGGATRFDYQSMDPGTRTLYLSHMGDGELIAFDMPARKVIAHLPGFPTVTGVQSPRARARYPSTFRTSSWGTMARNARSTPSSRNTS